MRVRYLCEGADTIVACSKVQRAGKYLLIEFTDSGLVKKFSVDAGSDAAAIRAMQELSVTGCVDIREFVIMFVDSVVA